MFHQTPDQKYLVSQNRIFDLFHILKKNTYLFICFSENVFILPHTLQIIFSDIYRNGLDRLVFLFAFVAMLSRLQTLLK